MQAGVWSCHASYGSRVEVRTGAGTWRAHSGNFFLLASVLQAARFHTSRARRGLKFEICASRACQDRPAGVSDCEFKSQLLRVSSSASRRAQIASALKFDSRSASPLAARRTKQRRSITPSPRARKIQTRAIAAQNTDARHRRATAQTRDPPPAGRPRCSGSTSTGRRPWRS